MSQDWNINENRMPNCCLENHFKIEKIVIRQPVKAPVKTLAERYDNFSLTQTYNEYPGLKVYELQLTRPIKTDRDVYVYKMNGIEKDIYINISNLEGYSTIIDFYDIKAILGVKYNDKVLQEALNNMVKKHVLNIGPFDSYKINRPVCKMMEKRIKAPNEKMNISIKDNNELIQNDSNGLVTKDKQDEQIEQKKKNDSLISTQAFLNDEQETNNSTKDVSMIDLTQSD